MTNNTSAQHLSTQQISLFQNGIAFFHKTGKVDASTGQVRLEELPIGTSAQRNDLSGIRRMTDGFMVLFGSAWFFSAANPLLRTAVFDEEVETQVAAASLTEILQNNLDKSVRLTLKNDASPYSGKIVSLTDGSLLLKMEKGWKQIALEAIDYLDFAEDPNLFRKSVTQKTILQLDFAKAQKALPIDLIYVQKGIGWVPVYQLQLLGNNQARLRLKANLINDAEDLQGVRVNFVLGVPSFFDLQEPLFSSQSLNDFLQDLRNRPRPVKLNNDFTKSIIQHARVAVNASPREGNQDASGGLSDEDQFFYQAENVSLPKGGRMLIHLLETDISYEDIYSARLDKEKKRFSTTTVNTVWHSLKFKNASGLPLPTGAISFVKDENGVQQPIGQNRLDFVPAGLLARIKMSQVPDAFVFDHEKIIDREEKAGQKLKSVTVEATIEAGNFKKKAITLEIEREIAGKLLSSDSPWTTSEPDAGQPGNANQSREVRWVLSLQPGEQKKITYSYSMHLG